MTTYDHSGTKKSSGSWRKASDTYIFARLFEDADASAKIEIVDDGVGVAWPSIAREFACS